MVVFFILVQTQGNIRNHFEVSEKSMSPVFSDGTGIVDAKNYLTYCCYRFWPDPLGELSHKAKSYSDSRIERIELKEWHPRQKLLPPLPCVPTLHLISTKTYIAT